MPTTLADLQALDSGLLTSVLRRVEGGDDLEVRAFTAEPLQHRGIVSQDALFMFQGVASSPQTEASWALVLKILREPPYAQQPDDLWYWKREALAAGSGLLRSLPGPLAAVRYVAVTEAPGEVWLWMEHVTETTGPVWTLDHYAVVARQLGGLNGVYLNGTPLPDQPWLLRNLIRQWTAMFPPLDAWQSPHVQAFFPAELHRRVTRLWGERESFYAALAALPQVFSHFDLQRRNVMLGSDEAVALDWGWCGIGPVGADLYSLVGSSCLLGEWDTARLGELEAVTSAAYLEGLRHAGWTGDPRVVRLGYAAWMALYFGLVCPALVAYWMMPERQEAAAHLFGGGPDELSARWATLCRSALARADEARDLVLELGRNL